MRRSSGQAGGASSPLAHSKRSPSSLASKILLKISFISYRDFSELYHGTEMDLLFTSLVVGLLSCMAWGLINWARFLVNGAETVPLGDGGASNIGSDSLGQGHGVPPSDFDAATTSHSHGTFIFMRLGWWWNSMSLLYIVGLLYFQLRITWRRHKTLQGFGALFTGFFSWIIALIVLFSPNLGDLLSLDMDRAFVALRLYWNVTLEEMTSSFTGEFRIPSNCDVLFKFVLSLLCAATSFAMVMPVTRMVKSHMDMRNDLMKQAMKNLSLHESVSLLNFVLPLVVALLWMQPVRDAFPNFDESLFNRIRLYGVFITAILQVLSVKPYLQSFLVRSATDCTKELDSKKPLSDSQFEHLQDRILNGMRLTFVVVCQLTFIPFMLMALGLLGNVRGKFTFGLGPPIDVIAGRPETFTFREQPPLTPGDMNSQVYAVSLAQAFFTETVGFFCWWIFASQVVLSLASFAMIRMQDRFAVSVDKGRVR